MKIGDTWFRVSDVMVVIKHDKSVFGIKYEMYIRDLPGQYIRVHESDEDGIRKTEKIIQEKFGDEWL